MRLSQLLRKAAKDVVTPGLKPPPIRVPGADEMKNPVDVFKAQVENFGESTSSIWTFHLVAMVLTVFISLFESLSQKGLPSSQADRRAHNRRWNRGRLHGLLDQEDSSFLQRDRS